MLNIFCLYKVLIIYIIIQLCYSKITYCQINYYTNNIETFSAFDEDSLKTIDSTNNRRIPILIVKSLVPLMAGVGTGILAVVIIKESDKKGELGVLENIPLNVVQFIGGFIVGFSITKYYLNKYLDNKFVKKQHIIYKVIKNIDISYQNDQIFKSSKYFLNYKYYF